MASDRRARDRAIFPEEGAILLWRRISGHRFWQDGAPFTPLKAWIDCLMRAAWAEHERYWHGQRVHLRRGQFVTSERELGKAWHRSRHWVRDFLDDIAKPFIDSQGVEHPPEAGVVRDQEKTTVTVFGLRRRGGPDGRVGTSQGPARDQLGTTIEERKERQEEDHQLPRGDSVGSGPFPAEGVGRVFEAFQKATGKLTRPPSARERTKIQAAIEANGGEFQAIAAFVGDVTAAAVRDGENIGSVSYGLTAWKNRHDERASKARDERDLPRDRVPKPPYHGPAQVGPKPPMSDSESKAGGEHVRGILERLGFKPSKGN